MASERVHEAGRRLFNRADNGYLRFEKELERVFAFEFPMCDHKLSSQMISDNINVLPSTLYF
jgi:hypothetical protein